MKQTWKVFTLTQKRQAIKEVKALVAKGNSVSKARLQVSRRIDVTATTLYNWERKLTGKATRSKGMTTLSPISSPVVKTNGTTKPHITSVNLHVPGKGNITLDHELLSNIAQLAGHVS